MSPLFATLEIVVIGSALGCALSSMGSDLVRGVDHIVAALRVRR